MKPLTVELPGERVCLPGVGTIPGMAAPLPPGAPAWAQQTLPGAQALLASERVQNVMRQTTEASVVLQSMQGKEDKPQVEIFLQVGDLVQRFVAMKVRGREVAVHVAQSAEGRWAGEAAARAEIDRIWVEAAEDGHLLHCLYCGFVLQGITCGNCGWSRK